MDAKIVEMGPMCLVGRPYFGSPEGGSFGRSWERFNAAGGEAISGILNPGVYIGLEVYGPEMWSENQWTYMPCVQVRDLSDVPGALFGKTLPASKYVVITAKHGLASIPEAFHYAYETWIPSSGYEVAYPFDFELYDDQRFHGDGPDEEIDVYIPVREKKA